jgi:hypothetical protein
MQFHNELPGRGIQATRLPREVMFKKLRVG